MPEVKGLMRFANGVVSRGTQGSGDDQISRRAELRPPSPFGSYSARGHSRDPRNDRL